MKRVQEKSPLDPDNFVDFKLKRVEPYNHNTAMYVPSSLLTLRHAYTHAAVVDTPSSCPTTTPRSSQSRLV